MIYWTGPPQLIPPIPKIYCGIKDFLIAFAGSKSEAIKLLEKCTKSSKIDTSLIYEEIRQKRNVVSGVRLSGLPQTSQYILLICGSVCWEDFVRRTNLDICTLIRHAPVVLINLKSSPTFSSNANLVLKCGFALENG